MQKHFFIRILLCVIIITASYSIVFSQYDSDNENKGLIADSMEIDDGPYIFIKENTLIEKRIVKGKVICKELSLNSLKTEFIPEPEVYSEVKKIAALSDIHGQYDVVIKILINNKIINENLEWNFGKGHLVIVGDIFDRGEKVTETLWLVYNLEKQAEKKGGKVHFLTGNHEYMVLHNDIRYIHDKYKISSDLLNTPYHELYGKNTVLGRWLRSKHALIKINDVLYSHAGISKEFISQGFDITDVNDLMRNAIDVPKQEKRSDSVYRNYFGSNGPIWYRGYFKDEMKGEEIELILNSLNVKILIVGHTTQREVRKLFGGKVYAVDSGIKYGKEGELLLIKKDRYYRLLMSGEKIVFE